MMRPVNQNGQAILRVAVLDPGRRAASDAALRRMREIVDALQGNGVRVDWYVDEDDGLHAEGDVHVHKVLPAADPPCPASQRSAGLVADTAIAAKPAERVRRMAGMDADHAPLRSPTDTAGSDCLAGHPWLSAVERADRWARRTWHRADAPVVASLGALGAWALIRCYYQLRWSAHTAAWHVGAAARTGCRLVRWRVIHPAARWSAARARLLYWRIFFRCIAEPAAGAAKRLRWRIVHPVARRAASLGQRFYWRLLFRFLVEPTGVAARHVRWRIAHPIGQRAASFARWLYWRLLFRFLVEPAGVAARYLRWQIAHPAWQSVGSSVRRLYWRALFPFIVEPVGKACGSAGRHVAGPSSRLARTCFLRLRSPGGRSRRAVLRQGRLVLNRALGGARKVFSGVCAGPSAAGAHQTSPWLGTFAAAAADWRVRGMPHVVLLADATPGRLEALFGLVPALGLDAPLDVPLIAFFDSAAARSTDGPAGLESLRERWQVGGPFRWLRPLTIGPAEVTANAVLSAAALAKARDIAREIIRTARRPEREATHGLVCNRFGPLAIVLSALWGQVGSTIIFETQARFMMARGYRVARVYVDHWPQRGAGRSKRLQALTEADQARQRPHLTLVMERSERRIARHGPAERPVFKPASPVGRFAQALGNCTIADAVMAGYVTSRAVVMLVNHAQHMIAARQVSDAPILLETHDVLADLLDLHGIPSFVRGGHDSPERRLADERWLWSQAECCINLSRADHARIAPFARRAALIRPYRLPARASDRSWPEIVVANGGHGWSANAAARGSFDLMLWGSWHDNNIRSIRWFFDKVLPRLPGARGLRIVLAGAVVRGMGDLSQVACELVTCPEVDRLEDLAARASILVIPDQGGTGISIKTMDALAWRACLAATPDAFRALDITQRQNCSCATAEALAGDISRLLNSATERAARRAIGWRIFRRNYSAAAYEAGWAGILDGLGLIDAGPVQGMRRDAPEARGKAVAGSRRAQGPAGSMQAVLIDMSSRATAMRHVRARDGGFSGPHSVVLNMASLPGLRRSRRRSGAGDILACAGDDAIMVPVMPEALIAPREKGGAAMAAGDRRTHQGQCCRRAAWQAVSDAMESGGRAVDRAAQAVLRLEALVQRRQGVPLLPFRQGAGSEPFPDDVAAAYAMVASVLAGGGAPAKARGPRRRPIRVPCRPACHGSGQEPAGEPRVSVVVATYDRYDDLPRAIASLLDQDVSRGFLEIIVVDNSPDRDRAEAFADRYAGLAGLAYLIAAEPGLSNARNVGLARSRAPIVAFMDDDALAAPDWARRIDEAFQRLGDDVAALGGRVLPRFVSARPTWLADELMSYLSIIDWPGGARVLKRTEWIAGCNMAFRRPRLIDAGGFPLRLGRKGGGHVLLSNEESAVVARLREQGQVVAYAPQARVEHVIDPARLDRAWFRRRAAWQAVSDCVQDGESARERARASAQHLKHAARDRFSPIMCGRFADTADPDAFRRQVALAYDMTLVALAGDVEMMPGGETQRPGFAVMAGGARAHMLTHPRVMRFGRRLRDSIVG